jgi:hypothetical protein
MDLILLFMARSVGGTNQAMAIYCQLMLGMVSFKMKGIDLLHACLPLLGTIQSWLTMP